ncbi:hypothetical protein PM082_022747 [Marasmius tenuissimus]|nr:hypothetical protein PM082_022747 [Marasmius tenuissimus]
MSSNLFSNAKQFRIGDYATIQNVGGDVTTNVYGQRDFVNLSGNMFRRIPMGDIIVRKSLSSEVLHAHPTVESEHVSTLEPRLLKVKKTVDHVAVLGLPGGFTSITVEPSGSEDQTDEFNIIADRVCREMSCQRSPLLTQLVGLGWSERLTLIVHDGM